MNVRVFLYIKQFLIEMEFLNFVHFIKKDRNYFFPESLKDMTKNRAGLLVTALFPGQ